MKLRYPELKDEYDYIIENIIPVTTDDDSGWYDEYIDYILNNILSDIDTIKTYKYRAEKLEKIRNNLTEKQRLEEEQGMKELGEWLDNSQYE